MFSAYNSSSKICTVSSTGAVKFTGIRTCRIEADQAAAGNYAAADPVRQDAIIKAK